MYEKVSTNLNFVDREKKVEKFWNDNHIFEKSIRIITMPDFLADEFREYCSHLYGIMKNERLFHFTKSHMEHCMAAGIEKSGVKRIRLHDLRHSHASMLVDMGVALVIMLRMNKRKSLVSNVNYVTHKMHLMY